MGNYIMKICDCGDSNKTGVEVPKDLAISLDFKNDIKDDGLNIDLLSRKL